KDWGDAPPYPALGRAAVAAAGLDFPLGNVGAGYGAKAGRLKGGLGSASVLDDAGLQVGALIAANPVGSVVAPGTGAFWAAPLAQNGEFPDRPPPAGTSLDLPAN